MTITGDSVETAAQLATTEDFSRSVTALFDTRDHAETARQDLIAAGIHADAIALIADTDPVEIRDDAAPAPGGFWETLTELFMPEEDRHQFAEGVRRGGVTVAVWTDTSNHDRVMNLLDRDGAVNLDERQEHWRHEGWTGATGRDPLIYARSPSLAVVADDEDMAYRPPSNATAGFGVSGIEFIPVDIEAAPPVESPGALPPSSLEAGLDPEPQAAAATRGIGTGRVRAYSLPAGKTFPSIRGQ